MDALIVLVLFVAVLWMFPKYNQKVKEDLSKNFNRIQALITEYSGKYEISTSVNALSRSLIDRCVIYGREGNYLFAFMPANDMKSHIRQMPDWQVIWYGWPGDDESIEKYFGKVYAVRKLSQIENQSGSVAEKATTAIGPIGLQNTNAEKSSASKIDPVPLFTKKMPDASPLGVAMPRDLGIPLPVRYATEQQIEAFGAHIVELIESLTRREILIAFPDVESDYYSHTEEFDESNIQEFGEELIVGIQQMARKELGISSAIEEETVQEIKIELGGELIKLINTIQQCEVSAFFKNFPSYRRITKALSQETNDEMRVENNSITSGLKSEDAFNTFLDANAHPNAKYLLPHIKELQNDVLLHLTPSESTHLTDEQAQKVWALRARMQSWENVNAIEGAYLAKKPRTNRIRTISLEPGVRHDRKSSPDAKRHITPRSAIEAGVKLKESIASGKLGPVRTPKK